METQPYWSGIADGSLHALTATPAAALSWAWERFDDRCCVLASMQDAAVIELAMTVDRRFPIVFLDTGYHFDETWQTLRAVERRYGIDVEVVGPLRPADPDVQPGRCCDDKPALLEMALAGREAWVSGVRRHQTERRSQADLVETDGRGRTKINPVVQWSDADHQAFVAAAHVIRNPLVERGYFSIGCEPCTSAPISDDDPRSGRWAGSNRTECGLHL